MMAGRIVNMERFDALADQDCLSYAEIARRLGVSRERIRQIDMQRNNRRGIGRKLQCPVTPPAPPRRPFVAECERRGLKVESVGRYGVLTSLKVNGWRVKLLGSRVNKRGVVQVYGSPIPADLYVYELPNGEFLIVPPGTLRDRRYSQFALRPKYATNRRTWNGKRHDWQLCRNAFHLLESPKAC